MDFLREEIEPIGVIVAVLVLVVTLFQVNRDRLTREAQLLGLAAERLEAARVLGPSQRAGQIQLLERIVRLGVSLKGIDASSVTLQGADFTGADLSESDLMDTNLAAANFANVKLARANLTRANFLNIKSLTQEQLNSACGFISPRNIPDGLVWMPRPCSQIGANLAGVNLNGGYFARAHLAEADFTEADLSGAKIVLANLADADFTNADLSAADFTRANLPGADFTRANLPGADFTRANLSGADFNHAVLTRADLAGADLENALNLTQEQLDSACGDSPPLNIPARPDGSALEWNPLGCPTE